MLTVAILLTGSHISFYAQETEVEVLDVGLEITENDEIFLETESQGRQIMESQSSNSRSVSLLFTVNRLVQSNAGLSASKAESTIIGALTQYNVPVLVGVRTLSGSTHFVVASGYASTNDIIIRDPASRNYTKLNQYLDAGYYVHRIYCFTK